MGIPAPGETILLLAAAAAATGIGNIYLVIGFAAFGAILGDNVAYFLGKKYGRSVLSRITHLNEEKLAHSEAFFERHGAKTIFIARFIPIVRMVAAYLAGINRMKPSIFMSYNIAGGITWAVVMGSLGYFFGKNLHILEEWLRRIGGIVVAIFLLGLLLFWLNRRWQQNEEQFRMGRVGTLVVMFQSMWRWVASRGRRGLILYGLLLLLSGWAVGVLIDDFVDRDPDLFQRDMIVTVWLQAGVRDVPAWVETVSWLGDFRFLALVTALTAVWQWRRQNRGIAGLTLLSFAGLLALGWGLQLWFQRPLPLALEPAWLVVPYSFPNLTSMLSVTTYGWLVALWNADRPLASWINTGTLATFLVLSIAFIDLFLGQGFFTDVLVGLGLGFLWLGLPYSLLYWATPVVEAPAAVRR